MVKNLLSLVSDICQNLQLKVLALLNMLQQRVRNALAKLRGNSL